MKILKYIILLVIALFLIWINNSYSAINFNVSPIKYEIEMSPWSSIIKTAQIRNNWTWAVTIYTWKSDFESSWTSWTPRFVRYSELVHPDQQLSTWLTIDTPQFIINAWEEKTINFQISIPTNATPGWHYWAIFFKNPNSASTSWPSSWTWGILINADYWINVDYWILLLVNVSWEVSSTWSVWPIIITPPPWNWWWGSWDWWWWGWWYSDREKDNCPLWDLTKSRYDNKCIDNIFDNSDELDDTSNENWNNNWSWTEEWNNNQWDNLNNSDTDNLDEEDFEIWFEIPFKNEWNTHIKLEWNIVLTDEDWNQIKWIWKEFIKNKDWAVLWERIVDYIPVNDSDWKILPWTERVFQCEWKWFPYEDRNEKWEIIIKNWNPSEYYTDINKNKRSFLMFWERVAEREQHKKINADFNLSYLNEKWEEIEFNSAKEFYIDYTEEYIWLNPYVTIPIWFFVFLIFIWILILLLRRRKCSSCNKRIKKDIRICLYCWTNQDKDKLLKNKKDTENKKSKKIKKSKKKS